MVFFPPNHLQFSQPFLGETLDLTEPVSPYMVASTIPFFQPAEIDKVTRATLVLDTEEEAYVCIECDSNCFL